MWKCRAGSTVMIYNRPRVPRQKKTQTPQLPFDLILFKLSH